jgi:transcriptional regulator with XRE-family HTH domain
LTLQEVESRSRRIALVRGQKEFIVTAGRLSQVETSSTTPSIYKLASLSQIYQKPYQELLQIYGVELDPLRALFLLRPREADEAALAVVSSAAR